MFDARDVNTAAGMFDAIIKHIKYGTNKGKIRYLRKSKKRKKKGFILWAYGGTSRKRPPLMSGLGGRLREVVAYGKFH